ncbi:hypothetical protein V9T40_007664 [Parthenolecanium corni]|uniref:Uncharacterized protein n=1 Tax=Parthenolecanium corni TaxID=536013 RepID=A0AAN9TLQ9_9HEMI
MIPSTMTHRSAYNSSCLCVEQLTVTFVREQKHSAINCALLLIILECKKNPLESEISWWCSPCLATDELVAIQNEFGILLRPYPAAIRSRRLHRAPSSSSAVDLERLEPLAEK